MEDGRGKGVPSNKKDHASIQQHIESFNPQVSHYNLEHAPFRRYMDSDLTITAMWEDYKSKGFDVSYSVYMKVFNSMNIGFGRPSQDDCSLCLQFAAHKKSVKDIQTHDKSQCSECMICMELDESNKTARKAFQDDHAPDSPNTSVFATDMQKIILLPKMTSKEHFFVSRLVVFNQTFASLNEEQKVDYVVLWHEEIRGRNAADVASAYVKCINLAAAEDIIFWADNCASQNKNWILFIVLVWCVNQEWGPKQVTMKYLEKGHSFVRADSVHGSISRKMRKNKMIYDFENFVSVCENASK